MNPTPDHFEQNQDDAKPPAIMKSRVREVHALNILILGGILLSLIFGAMFHQVNMNRKYWTMVRAGCINTNALVNLEKETRENDLAKDHMTRVPRWIADINSTLRLGVFAVAVGMVINVVLMVRSRDTKMKANRSAALPPRTTPAVHSAGKE